jgi:hypothetical protein
VYGEFGKEAINHPRTERHMPDEVQQVRITRDLARHLEARVGGSRVPSTAAVAHRDLERYYKLVDLGQLEVQKLALSDGEASAICDAHNGIIIVAAGDPVTQITGNLADAEQFERLGERWGVDVGHLIVTLATLSPLGGFALVDAVERFWNSGVPVVPPAAGTGPAACRPTPSAA